MFQAKAIKQQFKPNEAKAAFFQPKLAINQPNDTYEQEADAMAENVMHMPDTSLNNNSFFKPAISSVQRKCAHCEEEEKKAQRKENNNDATVANTQTENYISSLNGKGKSLTPGERSFFEPRFGYDFSNVKIHTDNDAAKSAQSINAHAYTTGNNIVFDEGQYVRDTDHGKRLLGHELTHVVQQANENNSVHRSATITPARFAPGNAPTTSIAVKPSFIPGKWTIDMTTDAPGFVLESAVNVNCSGMAAGYEVGIVQVETQEFSRANYFGSNPSDGSLIVSKSQVRKPPGACIDARTGAFWTADASGEKSLKPPACGMNIALPAFSDRPSESYKGWIENVLTHKPNYIRDIIMSMNFTDALAVKLPSGIINVLKWLKWSVSWEGKFLSNSAGSTPTGITQGTGIWIFGDDNIRPPEIPSNFALPSKTCVDIAADATIADNVVETNASY